MTGAEAKRFIIPAVAGASILAAISDLESLTLPRLRIMIGAFVVVIVLTLGADVAPELAAGLAALILVGALLTKGGVIDRLGKVLA